MILLKRGILGVLGLIGGIVVSKLLDYAVFQMGNANFSDTWLKYNIISRYALAFSGMMLGIFAIRRKKY